MSAAFAEFAARVRGLAPRTAVVLGSGLGEAAAAFREIAAITFGDIPGLVPPSIHGHRGQLAVGVWDEVPALIFSGRVHFYEGHARLVVSGPVRIAAELGIRRLVLTNAAGGIRPSLGPGALMAIRNHITLLDGDAWRRLAANIETASPYSPRLTQRIVDREAAVGRRLPVGTYAALTGPSYETPREIRALGLVGADAVGMSTAFEAEAARTLGMEVAAISCITNAAAGLSDAPLDHREVVVNAKLAVERLGGLLGELVVAE